MADKDCWLQLMSLDPVTGLDPEGTRLRAHEGLDGVDFFVPVRRCERRRIALHCPAMYIQGLIFLLACCCGEVRLALALLSSKLL